jgi:hypothetical protein
MKIACFSQDIDSAAMWGYYGDSGKGFALAYDFRNQYNTECIVYSKKSNCQSAKNATLFRTIYDDTPFDATQYATWLIQRAILQNFIAGIGYYDGFLKIIDKFVPCPDMFISTKILLHKAASWVHESEWRLILSCDSMESDQEPFSYVNKKPLALYLGRNIDSCNEDRLRKIAEGKNIPVYKMKMNKDDLAYKLQPELMQ